MHGPTLAIVQHRQPDQRPIGAGAPDKPVLILDAARGDGAGGREVEDVAIGVVGGLDGAGVSHGRQS